ncbi:MAG TPA: lamin tail domain-containing protein [Roseiflexaceae bacterium]|nr:lamin tail domain-containing protein [Roseiflexaceae bacterium]
MFALLLQGAPPIPASGYLLCFIPLATVIIGLITLFVLTDRHASRPYARYNPFVAAGAGAGELEGRPPVVGETPAGPLGAAPPGKTTVYEGQQGAISAADPEAVPPPDAPDISTTFEGQGGPRMPEDLGTLPAGTQERLKTNQQDPVTPEERVQESDRDASMSAAPPPPEMPPPVADAPPPAAPETVVLMPTLLPRIVIAHVEYDPQGSDREGEYVLIRNETNEAVDLSGWTLRDSDNKHTFTFPAFTVPPGAEVRLWSGSGAADAANLYWGSRGAIWNNLGDTAFLLDASGNEVSRLSYGG